MIVKVCGMREAENIKALIPLAVDWVGFIFYERSKRYVESVPEQINFLKTRGGYTRGLDRVGVFVNASKEYILEKVYRYHLKRVQLHGDENSAFCIDLQKEGLSVIKAISIGTDFNFRSLVAYEHACDFLLFDTKGEKRGGNGVRFNWQLLTQYTGGTPFLLSGGIGPQHVEDILALKHPKFAGIDLNSGFEIEPGVKNIEELKLFLEALAKGKEKGGGFWS